MSAPLRTAVRAARSARDQRHARGVLLEGLRTVRGWVVRLAVGAMAALLLLAVGYGDVGGALGGVALGVAAAAVVALVVRPWPGWGAAVLLLAGLRLLAGPVPGAASLAAALLAGHLTVAGGVLAARVPAGSRVELAVLAGLARRAWPLQVGAQALALVVRPLLTGAAPGAGAWAWRAAALAVAAGLLAAALPPSRRRQ